MRDEVQYVAWGTDMSRRRRYYGSPFAPASENVSMQPYRPTRETRGEETVEVVHAMPPGVVTEDEAMARPAAPTPPYPYMGIYSNSPIQKTMSEATRMLLEKFLKELEKI